MPYPAVTSSLQQIGWRDIATSVVTVTEIPRGIERVRTSDVAMAEQMDRWLGGMLAAAEPQILVMETASAHLLGRMYETPALRHFVITDPNAREQATGADLAIAAIAIAHAASIATRNVRHFLQINACFPLPGLFDPVAQAWHVRPP